VDPNRVYLMGISEGCYGTQILGPFMADRFGGASAMAGGVGDDVPAENLRNLAFRTDVGEHDTTFNRVGLAREFHRRMDAAAETWGGYRNQLHVQKGRGHGIDYRPGPKWMIEHERIPCPDTVVWTAKEHHGRRRPVFYWVRLEGRNLRGVIRVVVRKNGNHFDITAHQGEDIPLGDARITLLLNEDKVNIGQPVRVSVNGEPVRVPHLSFRVASMARALAERGDPNYLFPIEVPIEL